MTGRKLATIVLSVLAFALVMGLLPPRQPVVSAQQDINAFFSEDTFFLDNTDRTASFSFTVRCYKEGSVRIEEFGDFMGGWVDISAPDKVVIPVDESSADVQANVTVTVPPTAEDGKYGFIVQGFFDNSRTWAEEIWIILNGKADYLPQNPTVTEHLYEGSIASEDMPRHVYIPFPTDDIYVNISFRNLGANEYGGVWFFDPEGRGRGGAWDRKSSIAHPVGSEWIGGTYTAIIAVYEGELHNVWEHEVMGILEGENRLIEKLEIPYVVHCPGDGPPDEVVSFTVVHEQAEEPDDDDTSEEPIDDGTEEPPDEGTSQEQDGGGAANGGTESYSDNYGEEISNLRCEVENLENIIGVLRNEIRDLNFSHSVSENTMLDQYEELSERLDESEQELAKATTDLAEARAENADLRARLAEQGKWIIGIAIIGVCLAAIIGGLFLRKKLFH